MEASKPGSKSSAKKQDEEVHYHYHGGTGQSYSRTSTETGPDGDKKAVHHHYYYEPPRPRMEKSNKPKIAGALIIISAILGMLFGATLMMGAVFVTDFDDFVSLFSDSEHGDIFGHVTIENGTPLANVSVSIIGEELNTTTDKDGNYIIYRVPMGNQQIRVEADGYDTIEEKVFVSPENSDMNIDSEWDPEQDTSTKDPNEFDFVMHEGNEVVESGSYPPFEEIGAFLGICGVISIIFSVIALVGGFFAIKRKNLAIAVVGSIFGIIAIGFFVGAILSFIALFVLLLSKEEFS